MGSAAASSSTVVLLVGADTSQVIRGLGALPNVDARTFAGDDAPRIRESIATSPSTYLVHDADPLEHVASAWVEFFEDRASHGTLDLEIETAVGAFVRGETSMPDYYVVLEPESAPANWKHWWLGVLPKAAPSRVLPSASDAGAVRRLLRSLPTGKPWPEPAEWLPEVRFSIPDRVGLL
ncbi:hypothetical protein HQQ80_05925 [Microbacteriaceae bacterium VKM Ac-2855]|nr:hypothetical protein [Microbacteriaceae bacterium VKM Ac-2855]